MGDEKDAYFQEFSVDISVLLEYTNASDIYRQYRRMMITSKEPVFKI